MTPGKTTADLRKFLFETMEGVRSGSVSIQQAKSIADTAHKIIETADLELRYAETLSQLDKDQQEISPGKILLTDESMVDGGES